jgi:CBS domain-containing protein
MKVRDLMTKTVASCRPETNLAAAGALMWETDCGVLPVVDDHRKVVGMITDRDVCIALTTGDRRASSLKVGDIVAMHAHVCGVDAEVRSALEAMQAHKVHRLPVVNKAGILEGILSMNDIVLRAQKPAGRKKPDISYEDVVETLQAICTHRSAGKQSAALRTIRPQQ